jgi:regulator of protease activity HflC (stomatin/prohibitin superfamily)
MRHALTIGSLLFVLVAAGCSSSPPLVTESSTSAIRAAEAVGATSVPRAALHLQLAKENLDRANVLAEKGEREEATSLLLRAEADAELAILLSTEQEQKSEATLAMERARQLQNDNR